MTTYSENRERLKDALLACKANFNRNSAHDMIMVSWSSLIPGSGLNFSDVKSVLDEVFDPDLTEAAPQFAPPLYGRRVVDPAQSTSEVAVQLSREFKKHGK